MKAAGRVSALLIKSVSVNGFAGTLYPHPRQSHRPTLLAAIGSDLSKIKIGSKKLKHGNVVNTCPQEPAKTLMS